MIGIVISTELEAAVLLEHLAGEQRRPLQSKDFHTGLLKGAAETVLCICGVGKANAAHGTTMLIEHFRPRIVYSLGVAGAYPSAGLGVGDIAVAEREVYGDEGVVLGESFCTMERIGLPLVSKGDRVYYNELPMTVPPALEGFSPRGTFITVSSCSGTLDRGRMLERYFNGICETMEGAAVAHICTLAGVPAAGIRGISNIIEDRSGQPLRKSDIITAAETVQRFFLERVI
ncbi:MAG: futalosine hydrolase [Nitrospirota bacterium]